MGLRSMYFERTMKLLIDNLMEGLITMNHTPTPWRASVLRKGFLGDKTEAMREVPIIESTCGLPDGNGGDAIVLEIDPECVRGAFRFCEGKRSHEIDLDECKANAAHIVKCVNAHDELVAALQACAEVFADLPASLPDCRMTRANALARAALAKVQS